MLLIFGYGVRVGFEILIFVEYLLMDIVLYFRDVLFLVIIIYWISLIWGYYLLSVVFDGNIKVMIIVEKVFGFVMFNKNDCGILNCIYVCFIYCKMGIIY